MKHPSIQSIRRQLRKAMVDAGELSLVTGELQARRLVYQARRQAFAQALIFTYIDPRKAPAELLLIANGIEPKGGSR